ncbi:GNAT family N-acetyltransferase [Kushneria aurantia]|uniref:GNAT family N-acetyltransferase n=1 Tax=Kushneria aurantia TaxID=504092 RepID=A0ABV6G5G9_9GAMM|nr:GNAT family N-acetyltransferase [Kushneria aurantia]
MTQSDASSTRRVDAFVAEACRLQHSDLARLHQLAVSVYWPHRAPDLALLMSLGQGYLALDEIDRVLASGMYFHMGSDFAMIGMMMTAPRLQARGAGRWLLDRLMADCAGRDLRLNATRPAYRLYENAGFVPVAAVRQHQGLARPVSCPGRISGLSVREVEKGDDKALRQLDIRAFGADRSPVLDALFKVSSGMVAMRNDMPTGFALIRDFGRGRVIGPVVAEDEEMAISLISPLIQRHEGYFLRLDTPMAGQVMSEFLIAAGLAHYDSVTQMRLGRQRGGDGVKTFGLAAQAIG